MIKRAILVLPVEEISVVDSEISKSEVLYQVVDMVIYSNTTCRWYLCRWFWTMNTKYHKIERNKKFAVQILPVDGISVVDSEISKAELYIKQKLKWIIKILPVVWISVVGSKWSRRNNMSVKER